MQDAVAMSRGEAIGPVIPFPTIREARRKARLTREQMAPLLGLSLSGRRRIERGQRGLSGPAAALLGILGREPEPVRRAFPLGPR